MKGRRKQAASNPSIAPPIGLSQFQNWMQAIIQHPLGPAVAAKSDAMRWIELPSNDIERVVLPSKTLTGLERISIYAEMYAARLVDCLQNDFPALAHALGADAHPFFHRFVAARPSTSWTLNRLGAPLPGYLREHVQAYDNGEFLAELATLERAVEEAFDASRATTLTPKSLRSIPPSKWGEIRFAFSPAFSLHAFAYPVNRYYDSFRNARPIAIPRKKSTWIAITRPQYQVFRHPLSRLQHALLTALHEDRLHLGDAVERLARNKDREVEKALGSIGDWFETWTRAGFFRAARAS